jgi:hypothetical protein
MYRSALPEPTDDLISIFSTRKPDSFYWEIETEKVCPGGKTAPGFLFRTIVLLLRRKLERQGTRPANRLVRICP